MWVWHPEEQSFRNQIGRSSYIEEMTKTVHNKQTTKTRNRQQQLNREGHFHKYPIAVKGMEKDSNRLHIIIATDAQRNNSIVITDVLLWYP